MALTSLHCVTGHLLMGDATYNHIYHDGSTGSVTQRIRQAQPESDDDSPGLQVQPLADHDSGQQPMPDEAVLGQTQGPCQQPLPVQAATEAAGSQGMGALHSAIVGHLQMPAPTDGAQTPQGEQNSCQATQKRKEQSTP